MTGLRPASRTLCRRITISSSATAPLSTATSSPLRSNRHRNSVVYSSPLRSTSSLFVPASTISQPTRRALSTSCALGKSSSLSSSSSTPTPTPSSTHSDSKPETPQESSNIPPSKIYTFEEIKSLSSNPTATTIIIDVREPSELLGTGRIPTAHNLPISSAPDSFFMPADEFEEKFGFKRPGKDTEVVFYCKAGVRSKAAARLAGQAGFGGKVGEFPGSWVEWFDKGGRVDRSMEEQ